MSILFFSLFPPPTLDNGSSAARKKERNWMTMVAQIEFKEDEPNSAPPPPGRIGSLCSSSVALANLLEWLRRNGSGSAANDSLPLFFRERGIHQCFFKKWKILEDLAGKGEHYSLISKQSCSKFTNKAKQLFWRPLAHLHFLAERPYINVEFGGGDGRLSFWSSCGFSVLFQRGEGGGGLTGGHPAEGRLQGSGGCRLLRLTSSGVEG